jgi:hypothetical protein
MDRICQRCGGPFKCRPHKVREGKGKYCSKSCSAKALRTGRRSPNWRGGLTHDAEGYLRRWTGNGQVLEHRRLMAIALGRPLESHEIVHHINGDKQDNSPGNLKVMTQSEHARLHNLSKTEDRENGIQQ